MLWPCLPPVRISFLLGTLAELYVCACVISFADLVESGKLDLGLVNTPLKKQKVSNIEVSERVYDVRYEAHCLHETISLYHRHGLFSPRMGRPLSVVAIRRTCSREVAGSILAVAMKQFSALPNRN